MALLASINLLSQAQNWFPPVEGFIHASDGESLLYKE